jgi:membrane protein
MNWKAIYNLLKETLAEWSKDSVPRMGAAMAYYTIFSIAPLLLIVIGIAGLVFGQEAAQGAIMEQITGLVGPTGAQAIEAMLANASKPSSGLIATAIGVVTLLAGATGVFGELQAALNTIWDAPERPSRGLLGILRDRVFSLLMVIGMGFLLLVSLVLSAGLAALSSFYSDLLPIPAFVLQGLNFVISFVVITVLFAMMYKILPDVAIAWRDVWVGAALTAFLFTIGKGLIGLYLGKAGFSSAYGAAGSLVVILVWIYYSTQVLLLGAEFTYVYAKTYGSAKRENAGPTASLSRPAVPEPHSSG